MKMQEYIEETRRFVPQMSEHVRAALAAFQKVQQLADDYGRCETADGRSTLAGAIVGLIDGGFGREFRFAASAAERLAGLVGSYKAKLGPRKPKLGDPRQIMLEGLE